MLKLNPAKCYPNKDKETVTSQISDRLVVYFCEAPSMIDLDQAKRILSDLEIDYTYLSDEAIKLDAVDIADQLHKPDMVILLGYALEDQQ